MDYYNPKIFALTGSTGALGLAFLQRFFAENRTVKARLLVRRESSSFHSETFQTWLRTYEDRVELIDGDMRHLSDTVLDHLIETDGGLWHFAAMTSLTAVDEDVARQIHEINVEGTVKLVEAFLRHHHPGPFYHISTAYVLGTREGKILEDESQVGQTFRNPYEASKLAAEQHVHRAFAAGIHGAIFRPSIVVDNQSGPGGFKVVDACAYAVGLAIKRGEPFVFRLPETAGMNLVHSDWIIAALIDLARLPSNRQTYHLTTPKNSLWIDIVQIIKQHVPHLEISFQPELTRAQLPSASKLFDKAVSEVRPYFEAQTLFDRTHTERDLSPTIKEQPMDLTHFVNSRLASELSKVRREK